MIDPLTQYRDLVTAKVLDADPVQAKAVAVLQELFATVLRDKDRAKPSLFKRLLKKDQTPPIKGVYMHGGVGRGKSMLMELFYDTVPSHISKRRVHFHEFMIGVHNYIHAASNDQAEGGTVDQALPHLAEDIAAESRLLCFDEFHVTDITDAMILGRLFNILFQKGVIVVATSNWAPDDLYKGGLQRERFLPFIDVLKSHVTTVHLDSPHDYRAETVQVDGTFFTPLNANTTKAMDAVFARRIGAEKPQAESFVVKGREITVRAAAKGVARFTFAQLCERPHGAEDYLEIARRYHTVFLENIPRLGYDRRNEVKRLMNLIDALYEARVKVYISAAKPAERLYMGHDHAYEFERCVSRLLEMQSAGYP